MQEEFLHYVWKHQKLNLNQLYTSSGERIELVSPGQHNFDAGPDFFNAQIRIDGQLWVGNIELHINSSDWYRHNHQSDPVYQNVILHVVWKHDMEVLREDNQSIPVLELHSLISDEVIQVYNQLKSTKSTALPCVSVWPLIESFYLQNWIERLYIERLESKYKVILKWLKKSNYNWEYVLFQMLLKNFGLKVNGDSFEALAKSIPFNVIQKTRPEVEDLEALLMGHSGLLPAEPLDEYSENIKRRYNYIQRKFDLRVPSALVPKFFRLRPPNFPTIRLSQFAQLWHEQEGLFSKLMAAKTTEQFYKLFSISSALYWQNHFTFGKISRNSKKRLTPSFIDLLLVNTIIPLKFAYHKYLGDDPTSEVLDLIASVPIENNSIVNSFKMLKVAKPNALHSQGLIQLKLVYCNTRSCLKCAIGNIMLSKSFNP